MRFLCIQHEPFEPPGNISKWADQFHHTIDIFKIYTQNVPEFPKIHNYDSFILLGGAMSVNDENKFPWMKPEKEFLKSVIDSNKYVLGICLGAQLIADALNAKVYPMQYKEIGFFTTCITDHALNKTECFQNIPTCFLAFHWHGEQFDIPENSLHLAYTQACKNQAFEYNNGKVLALQFHLETSRENLSALIANSNEDLQGNSSYVQSLEYMHDTLTRIGDESYSLLVKVLNNWISTR